MFEMVMRSGTTQTNSFAGDVDLDGEYFGPL